MMRGFYWLINKWDKRNFLEKIKEKFRWEFFSNENFFPQIIFFYKNFRDWKSESPY